MGSILHCNIPKMKWICTLASLNLIQSFPSSLRLPQTQNLLSISMYCEMGVWVISSQFILLCFKCFLKHFFFSSAGSGAVFHHTDASVEADRALCYALKWDSLLTKIGGRKMWCLQTFGQDTDATWSSHWDLLHRQVFFFRNNFASVFFPVSSVLIGYDIIKLIRTTKSDGEK